MASALELADLDEHCDLFRAEVITLEISAFPHAGAVVQCDLRGLAFGARVDRVFETLRDAPIEVLVLIGETIVECGTAVLTALEESVTAGRSIAGRRLFRVSRGI